MKYFKEITESGEIVLLLTYGDNVNINNPLIVEITKEEYETILSEIIPDVSQIATIADYETALEELGV